MNSTKDGDCIRGCCLPPGEGALVQVSATGRGSRKWEFWERIEGQVGVATGQSRSWAIDLKGRRHATQFEVLIMGIVDWFYDDEVVVIGGS